MRCLVIACAVALGGAAAAQPPVGGPPARESRRATVGGAYDRSLRVAPPIEREYDHMRRNTGRDGRVNATRDAVRAAETPALQAPPLSNW